MQDTFQVQDQSRRKRVRTASSAGQIKRSMTWKQDHRLPQSSPVIPRPHTSLGQSMHISETVTLSNGQTEASPIFQMPSSSLDHDDFPMHSFQDPPSSSLISSSPPRTPEPARHTSLENTKQGGADLLLHFAYSPTRSPAVNFTRASEGPPSTPPSQHTNLPSSVMNTPGNNLGLFNGALLTPGQNFNFADFVNVTPSPAQPPWGSRTPGFARTPHVSRRGLNFDHLAPTSADMSRKTPVSRGLALELGEELMPRS